MRPELIRDADAPGRPHSRRALMLLGMCAAIIGSPSRLRAELKPASPSEKAGDTAAFADVEQALAQVLTDVESVAVVQGGQVVYEFYRDGAMDKLRDVQSVEKSALSALVGIALEQGYFKSVDQSVAELMPDWISLNNDSRARNITLRHLLTMTAGFEVKDAGGKGEKLQPAQGWSRPLAATPGEKFSYDNSIVPMIAALLEKVTGMPLPDYARQSLVGPLGMMGPSYPGGLRMRTMDMAKLGHLFLSNGMWGGKQILASSYVADATRVQNSGGPPVSLFFGFMWWVLPSVAPGGTFMASGYAGQLIWVSPARNLVIAVTSTVSPGSQNRGHAVQLLRTRLLPALERRARDGTKN